MDRRFVTVGAWMGIVFLFACVLALNYWSVPTHDELSFAFGGQSSSMEGWIPHIASFSDILRQQIRDYSHSISCRVITNSICATFAMYHAYGVFDILNTGVWFLLVVLVLRETKRNDFFFVFSVVFWICWESESCSKTSIHAMNYLWAAVFALFIVKWWREDSAWWTIPLFGIFGAWSETFSLPMTAALSFSWLTNRKERGGWIRCAQFLSLVCGAAFVSLGPSLRHRTSRDFVDNGLAWVLIEKIKMLIRLSFHPPFFMIIAALVILLVLGWRRRRRLPCDEWAWFTLFGGLFYAAAGITGSYRIALAFLLGATILVLRELPRCCVVWRNAFIAFVFAWIGIAALVQIRLGEDYKQMLSLYAKDPQGLTYLPARCVFPFQKTCTVDNSNRWHLHFHQLMHSKDVPMAILSPRLYKELYQEGRCEGVYVMHNRVPPPWRHFFHAYFPPEDAHVSLPSRSFVIETRKGTMCEIRSDVEYK